MSIKVYGTRQPCITQPFLYTSTENESFPSLASPTSFSALTWINPICDSLYILFFLPFSLKAQSWSTFLVIVSVSAYWAVPYILWLSLIFLVQQKARYMHLYDMKGMVLSAFKGWMPAVDTQRSGCHYVNRCKLWLQLFPVSLVSCQPTTTILKRSGDWNDLSRLWFLPVHLLDLYQYVLWSIPQSVFRMIAMKKICGIQKAYLLCIIKKAIEDKR